MTSTLTRPMQDSARRSFFGLRRASGHRRVKEYERGFHALNMEVSRVLGTYFEYLRRGTHVSQDMIRTLDRKMRHFTELYRIIMLRIRANRNNIHNGHFRHSQHVSRYADWHTSTRSRETKEFHERMSLLRWVRNQLEETHVRRDQLHRYKVENMMYHPMSGYSSSSGSSSTAFLTPTYM